MYTVAYGLMSKSLLLHRSTFSTRYTVVTQCCYLVYSDDKYVTNNVVSEMIQLNVKGGFRL